VGLAEVARYAPVAARADENGRAEYALKRRLDLFLASVGLILTAPAWLILSLAIKLEDGGSVFHRQERWGKGGTKFRAIKFRSMMADGDPVSAKAQATHGDPRITRVGWFMRKAALDELPQLVNILHGDMSFVGPRALPVNELQRNDREAHLPDDQVPGFALRCSVRPGLTGIAQLYAPRDIARRYKFRYDAIYVRRQTLYLDLRLILRSVWISLTAGWERYHHVTDGKGKERRVAR
jgi:lipopolysaccharide/colanic/teichoic acid biosynthesis glycosyltransferase